MRLAESLCEDTGSRATAWPPEPSPSPPATAEPQAFPTGADIIDGFLYWETLENTTHRLRAATEPSSAIPSPDSRSEATCHYTDGAFTGTLRVYRADVNAYFPVGNGRQRDSLGSGTFHSLVCPTAVEASSRSPKARAWWSSIASLCSGSTTLPLPLKSVVIYDGSAIPTSVNDSEHAGIL